MTRSLPIVGNGGGARSTPSQTSGDLVKKLDALWDHARTTLYRPRNAWTWFTLNRRFQLRFIRAEQLQVEVPAALLPDCDNCVNLCCTGPNAVVTLRLRDIAALCDANLSDAIDCAPNTEDRLPEKRAKSWAQRNLDASLFRKAFPILKRDDTGTCSLLTDARHCGAWPAWPLSCARYPYAIDVEHNVLFLAKGCESHRRMTSEDAPDSIRRLIEAAVDSYNQRVKDIILLHLMLPELHDIGLTPFLHLPPKFEKRLRQQRPNIDAAS